MANLIERPAQKTEVAPRNELEARNALARRGMAAGDKLWTDYAAVKAAPQTAPTQHLSGPGASTIKGIQPQSNTRKADVLAGLPQQVRAKAANMADGPKKLLALIHQRHSASKQAVEVSAADAATVMDVPRERAEQVVKALEDAGFIKRSYSRLGTLSGYVPSVPA